MSLDETKAISAADIVADPDAIPTLMQQYVLLKDVSMRQNYDNLIIAINMLGDYGWEVISTMMNDPGIMIALMRNTHYKRKFGDSA